MSGSYDIRFIVLLRDFKIYFENELIEVHSIEEIRHFFYLLIEVRLFENRFLLAINPDAVLKAADQLYFEKVCSELKVSRPIQYILGQAYFGDLKLKVAEGVLIPRPETMELVQWVLDFANSRDHKMSLLDIGTGSGCIALSLSLALPNAAVSAMDISEKALSIAKENTTTYKQQIAFEQADVLKLDHLEAPYDLIVSNPPYVRMLEKTEMAPMVLNYEPEQALFVTDENPLVFYEKIAHLALKALKEGGALFFEVNEYLAEETRQMLLETGFEKVHIKNDIFGKQRMIKALL